MDVLNTLENESPDNALYQYIYYRLKIEFLEQLMTTDDYKIAFKNTLDYIRNNAED